MININHKNYYLNPVKEIKKEQPVVVSETIDETEDINPYTEGYLYNLKKGEQVEILLSFGMEKKEIKKIKYEKDRVNTILDLMK